jgi:hypothetical protein
METCEQHGFAFPLIVAVVGVDGSVNEASTRYSTAG